MSYKLNDKNLKHELLKHNIQHPNIVMAQAKLESNNYKSKLTKTHNNIFGLKTGNQYTKYSHWTECVKDYKNRIQSRYTKGNYYAFLDRINYAEDNNYTYKIKQLE